jgi:DNA-binding transcriptional ArsR family regulator
MLIRINMSKSQKTPQLNRIAKTFMENKDACDRVLRMFSLFSNELRLKILCVLKEGDFCVNNIVELVGGKRSNISQQLKLLSLAGYLTKERHEKSIIYHLEDQKVRATVQFLFEYFKES